MAAVTLLAAGFICLIDAAPLAARTSGAVQVSVQVSESLAVNLDGAAVGSAEVIRMQSPDGLTVSYVILDDGI